MFSRRVLFAAVPALSTEALAQVQSDAASGSGGASSLESTLIEQTLPISSLSLATSRLAEERVTIPKLRRFAQFEVAEQTTLIDTLAELRSSLPSAAAHAPQPAEANAGDKLEAHLDPRGRETLRQLRDLDPGSEFTRSYFVLQANVHQQLLNIDEAYLKLGKELKFVNVVKLADALVREHLALLGEIKVDVDSGRGAARPGK